MWEWVEEFLPRLFSIIGKGETRRLDDCDSLEVRRNG